MSNKISDKDKKDWQNFLSAKEKLTNKDSISDKKHFLKTKYLDLHGYTLEQAHKTVEKVINNAYEIGVSKIIVVTGKGLHSNVENDPYVS